MPIKNLQSHFVCPCLTHILIMWKHRYACPNVLEWYAINLTRKRHLSVNLYVISSLLVCVWGWGMHCMLTTRSITLASGEGVKADREQESLSQTELPLSSPWLKNKERKPRTLCLDILIYISTKVQFSYLKKVSDLIYLWDTLHNTNQFCSSNTMSIFPDRRQMLLLFCQFLPL